MKKSPPTVAYYVSDVSKKKLRPGALVYHTLQNAIGAAKIGNAEEWYNGHYDEPFAVYELHLRYSWDDDVDCGCIVGSNVMGQLIHETKVGRRVWTAAFPRVFEADFIDPLVANDSPRAKRHKRKKNASNNDKRESSGRTIPKRTG